MHMYVLTQRSHRDEVVTAVARANFILELTDWPMLAFELRHGLSMIQWLLAAGLYVAYM